MDFDLSDEQRLIKDSIDRLALNAYDFDQRAGYLASAHGWSAERWQQYADLGLLALPFAEDDGGMGGSAVETMLVMEAFGRQLMLEPYLATVILAGGFFKYGATAEQRSHWIPKIIDGSTRMAFAQAETQSRFNLFDITTTATRSETGWIVSGHKRHVLHGDCADQLVVSARTSGDSRDASGITLFLVDAAAPGLTRRGYPTQDRLRSADIELDRVELGNDRVIGSINAAGPLIEQVVHTAIAALCAEAVGAMQRAHEITVDYLKTRSQFGVTIGSFQALQHRAVDMLVMVEQARSMSYLAAMVADEKDAAERAKAIAGAKVQIGRSARFVGQQSIQLHGGIGMTEECLIGHYFRRLSMIELQFGDADHHLSQLAEAGGFMTPVPVD